MARILLIDDDALLRGTLHQLLGLDGHEVLEAPDGESGLALAERGVPLDLVITDMLMPGVDGAQVIVQLKRLRPGLPVVAMSGGRRSLSPAFSLDSAGLAGAAQSLTKPFGRAALQAAVRSALPP